MALIRATVKLGRKSGIAADTCVNVWHFATTWTPAINDSRLTDVNDAIKSFYDAWGAQIAHCISRAPSAMTTEFRAVNTGSPGAGDDVAGGLLNYELWTLGTAAFGSTTDLPSEVASCLSLDGFGADAVPEESGATRPRSRHRGRLYLGPWTDNCAEMDPTTSEVGFNSIISSSIVTAYTDVFNPAIEAIGGIEHVIYSPTSGFSWAVEHVWMDNGFDIIRSRGMKAEHRSGASVS